MSYDSRKDTVEHIDMVKFMLGEICGKLFVRATEHDASKLEPPEKPIFDEYTPKLKGSTYGSEEYKQHLAEMKVALDHHYAANGHHPDHFEGGINEMTLIDLIEMLCDWKAATLRHANGDMIKSININKDRFKMSTQLTDILLNTVYAMEWQGK
jgi:hypothetical protein